MPDSSLPTKIGPYVVRAELGRGGMGVVFLAQDTRLDRTVAIKSLPADLANDPDRLARFEREAKVLASLNHPNIAAIYGLEEIDGHRFLILEYVNGQSIGDRLKDGAFPIDEALSIARQISEALEAAHEKGIVHRDLKPANVMIRDDGAVKVLDFGLARAKDSVAGSISANSPTGSYHETPKSPTIPGAIMGTAGYMSPEQARGKTVDKRSDNFAFGCVLYEMLTGVRTFHAESLADYLGAILHREPDWAELPPQTPPRVRELLQRCLEKDAKNRLRDIGDARIELEHAFDNRESFGHTSLTATGTHERSRSWRDYLRIGAGMAVGGAIALTAWLALAPHFLVNRATEPPRTTRFGVDLPPSFRVLNVAISPNGQSMIFSGIPSDDIAKPQRTAYLRQFGSFLTTSVDSPIAAHALAYSPDSAWFAMVVPASSESRRMKLVKAASKGSDSSVTIAELPGNFVPHSMVWSGGNDVYIAQSVSPAFVHVEIDTGRVDSVVPVVKLGGNSELLSIAPLAGSHCILAGMGTYGERGYQQYIYLIDPKSGEPQFIVEGGCPRYASTGHLLFTRADFLLAVRFDLATNRVVGSPVVVASGLRTRNSWANAEFDLSNDGTLAFIPGGLQGANRQVVTIDETGKPTPFCPDRRAFQGLPCISPNGQLVAATVTNAFGINEVWVSTPDRSTIQRVACFDHADCDPVAWLADNSRLIYSRRGQPPADDGLYIQAAEQGAQPSRVTKDQSFSDAAYIGTLVSDGKQLLVITLVSNRLDIKLLLIALDPAADRHQSVRTLLSNAVMHGADISRDGRWLACASSDPELPGLLVRAVNSDGTLGPASQVVRGDVNDVRFKATVPGTPMELMYVDSKNRSYIGTLSTSPVVAWKRSRMIVDASQLLLVDYWPRLLEDGRLLAIQAGPEETPPSSIHVVLNWFEELKQKTGARQ